MTDDQRRNGENGVDENKRNENGATENNERRYGKPAHAGNSGTTARSGFGRPAGGKFGRPAGNGGARPASGGKFGRPAGARSGASRPTDDTKSGERRYGKPAEGATATGAPAARPARGGFGRPAGNGGARPASGGKFGRPAGARSGASRPMGDIQSGERRYGKPAVGVTRAGEATARPARSGFGRPAGNGGARPASGGKFGRPAGARSAAPRPTSDTQSSERRYGKPAGGATRAGAPAARPARGGFGRSAGNGSPRPASNGTFGRPAGIRSLVPHTASAAPTGERRYGKPAPAHVPEPTTGLSLSARRTALDVLCDVHQNGAYASLSLDERLRSSKLSPEDRRLVTSIVYGTLENELRIDYAIDKLMDHPTHEAVQRDILRMSAYQVLFLDRVPDSAAVNEGVKLVKAMGMESASGFINAVLRNLVRQKDDMDWPKREDDARLYMSIMGSVPLWIVDKLIEAYGEEAEKLVFYRETAHPVVVRPNLTKIDDAAFEKLLEQKEWRFERGIAPHAFLLHGVAEITFDKDYQAGLFSIQGQSSMLAAQAVEAKPGMKILDACAAPGGKSAYLCETMQMTGRVYAWELHEKRALLLEGIKRRLNLENLRISVRDATEPRPDMNGTLDAVLLDAPCSGLGVMAQKPDIKLRLKPEDIPAIVDTQKRLLNTLCAYVKPGGVFVYSTCSVLPEENIEQVKAFISEHPEFTLETLPLTFPQAIREQQTPYGVQLLGTRDGVEGFFIARMRRKR